MSESCAGCIALAKRVEVLENQVEQPRIHTPGMSACDECETPSVKLTWVPKASSSLCDPCLKKYERKAKLAEKEAEKEAERAKKN